MFFFKLRLPSLWVLRMSDSNKSGMDKIDYYSRIKKISIPRSSLDLVSKELFPVSGSSSQKLWNLSDSVNEEEEKINIDYSESIDADMSESMSYSVCKYWDKMERNINPDFAVIEWILCAIPHICKYASHHSDGDHRKQVNHVIKK